MEELEAADWYRQRADDCDDRKLKQILLHNMGEEIEHASMLIEWLRRNDPHFAKQLKTYLFTTKDILKVEKAAEKKGKAVSCQKWLPTQRMERWLNREAIR